MGTSSEGTARRSRFNGPAFSPRKSLGAKKCGRFLGYSLDLYDSQFENAKERRAGVGVFSPMIERLRRCRATSSSWKWGKRNRNGKVGCLRPRRCGRWSAQQRRAINFGGGRPALGRASQRRVFQVAATGETRERACRNSLGISRSLVHDLGPRTITGNFLLAQLFLRKGAGRFEWPGRRQRR